MNRDEEKEKSGSQRIKVIDGQLLIDEDVLKDEYIGCHPCVCTSSLKIRTEDVIKKFLPAVKHEYKTVHLVGED